MKMELIVDQQKLNELKDAIALCDTIKVREISFAVEKHVQSGSNPFANLICRKSHLPLDELANILMPDDINPYNIKAFKSIGDGNCLYRSAST